METKTLKILGLRSLIDKNPITNPAKLFLISGFVFGLLVMIITPPFQGPDENIHFLRSAQLAKFDFTIDKQNEVIGGQLDSAYKPLLYEFLFDLKLRNNPNRKIEPKDILDSNSIDFKGSDSFYDFSSSASNPPLVYLPAAAGITISKALNMSPLGTFYAARLGGLLAWIAITYFAIKKIPTHKTALMIVNFLPMLVFQVSVVTADTLSFALLSLFVANVLYYRNKKEDLSIKDWVKLIAVVFFLSLSKRLFFVFVPLLLLIRPVTNKLRNRALQVLTIVASIPVSIAWGYAMEARFGSVILIGGEANPQSQIEFLKSDPLALKQIFQDTYFADRSVGLYKSFIGTFGWFDTTMSIFVICFSALITLLALSRASVSKNKSDEPPPERLYILEKLIWIGIATSYFFAVNLAIYLYYAPPRMGIFYGLQGRYFIPILLTALIMFQNGKRHDSERWVSQKLLFAASQLVLLTTVTVVAFRYYPIG